MQYRETLPLVTATRMEKTLEPGKKIHFGCRFGGEELVVIQISEEMAGNEKLAYELQQVLEKDNIRRTYMGKPKVAYKIATSEKLAEQFPDVAAGGFQLTKDQKTVQEVDLGRVYFASQPVSRKI